MNDPFARLGAAMVRLRWPVFLIWVILIPVSGGLGAAKASSVLKGGGFVSPGSESARAAEVLAREFNASNESNALVVFRSASQTVDDADFQAQVTDATKRLEGVEGVEKALTVFNTRDQSLVSQDRHTTFALVALKGDDDEVAKLVPKLREQLTGVTIEHNVTGPPAINHDLSTAIEGDLRRAEIITIPIVVILLLLVFRTVISAAIPMLLGACAVVTAIALLYVIGLRTNLSIFALNTCSMLGLGLGIDFSLIVVSRFREELAAGRDTKTAVALTMATAGRSITYSGIIVILGMLVLTVLLDLSLVRSMSLAILLVAGTALLGGLTLLPAVLGLLGRRIEWLPILPRYKPAQPGQEGFWYRLSHAIMRRPWIWLAVSVVLLLALASPVRDFDTLGATPGVLPKDNEAVKGFDALNDAFGANKLTPVQIVIRTPEKDGVWKPEFLDALAQTTDAVKTDPRVQDVSSLTTLANVPRDQVRTLTPQSFTSDPARAAAAAQYVNLNGNGDAAVITIVAKTTQYDKDHEQLVRDLRGSILPGIRQLRAYTVEVGGGSASFLDLQKKVYGRFPWVVAAVMLLTFLLLMMFFQSLFLPLKAILMNLATIAATYGAMVLVFQHGFGASLLDFTALGKITVASPVVLFVILFGLSTDYEVFMLSRVKEFYHETGNNEEAVAAGLQSTARVITAAGLILIGTFGSFSLARVIPIKEVGLGLAIGVLLDSTIVRIIMVPATMRLAGKANWWMPAWLKKIVPELREGPAPEPAPAPAAPVGMPLPLPQPPLASMGQPAAAGQPVAQPRAPYQAPAAATVGWLRPVGGSVGADQIRLPRKRPFRIGRDSQAEMWLFDQRISRYHARIDYDPQLRGFVVTDLNSTNGVYVNGQRITAPTLLRSGDNVEIGTAGNATFVFEAQAQAQPAAMAASPAS